MTSFDREPKLLWHRQLSTTSLCMIVGLAPRVMFDGHPEFYLLNLLKDVKNGLKRSLYCPAYTEKELSELQKWPYRMLTNVLKYLPYGD